LRLIESTSIHSSWHLVGLVTSRDCNHITWFCRNSASVSLLATLSHRTWIANDFFIISTLSKAIETSDCTFWKFFYKRKFFFLTHLLYAKSTFNSDRRLYKKRWCDLMRTWSLLAFTEIEFKLHFFWKFCRTDEEISFWLVLCTRKRHSALIEDYIRKDTVIWCELDCLAFTICCRENDRIEVN
jgi:hypothetical protein